MMVRLSFAAMLAVSALSAGCRGGESDKPPIHLIHNMDTQEKGRAYRRDTSGLFADGRTMRAPVEGTVAIGQLDEDDLLNEGLDNGQPSKVFPASLKDGADVKPEFRARGKARYNIYCAPCHGPEGDGKGTVAQPGRLEIPPPSFHDERLKGMFNGKIYSAIKNGVNNGNMPSYASQIPVSDRWAIISYIREMQKVGLESGEAAATVEAGKATLINGKALYANKGCNACHSLDGNKLVGPSFKGLYGKKESTDKGEVTVDDAYIKESILKPTEKVVTGFPPAMPPQQVEEWEIGSLVMFIQSLK